MTLHGWLVSGRRHSRNPVYQTAVRTAENVGNASSRGQASPRDRVE